MAWTNELLRVVRLLRPTLRTLPAAVYAHLVTQWKEPHERLQGLRCVMQAQPRTNGAPPVTLLRVVDPAALTARGLRIETYADLDPHPDLVLYQGSFAPGGGAHLTRITPQRPG